MIDSIYIVAKIHSRLHLSIKEYVNLCNTTKEVVITSIENSDVLTGVKATKFLDWVSFDAKKYISEGEEVS